MQQLKKNDKEKERNMLYNTNKIWNMRLTKALLFIYFLHSDKKNIKEKIYFIYLSFQKFDVFFLF